MPSHLHRIAQTAEDPKADLSGVMRDFKKYTSKKIIDTIPEINGSRKEWLLNKFQTGPDSFQVWQEGMHPVKLFTKRSIDQEMDYIHNNTVEAGIVREPQDYCLVQRLMIM